MTVLIYELISKVMGEIGFVSKEKKNESQGYQYRGIEDLYFAAHPALVRHGVFCCPQVIEYTSEDRVMKNGSPAVRVTMKIKHVFFAPDGSSIDVITCGEGVDSSDKATAKCMSMAMKYALIELFCVPTEDIIDADRTSPEAGLAGKGTIAEPITLTRPEKLPDPRFPDTVVAPTAGPPIDVQGPDDTPVYIDTHQRSYLSRRFRESLKPELEPEANRLRHKALEALEISGLFKSKFRDEFGNPSQDYILESEYSQVGKALVAAARSL